MALNALIFALLPLSAVASPIYADSKRLFVQSLASAGPEPQLQTPKLGQSDYVGDAGKISSLLALEIDSESTTRNFLSSWSDKGVIALVTVLLVNVVGLCILITLFRRQRRELRGIQLREIRLEHGVLQTEARRRLFPPLRPPPAGGTVSGQMSSTESAVTLVPHLPASRF
ncbi:hypothetical protein FB451DRAFT_1162251 [Mycena latifolia]|nr:hypothetical protein FB451DRAFT_1162251 [Mycena latifolia]